MEARKASDEELEKLYRTAQGGYLSAYKFYKHLRSLGYKNTVAQVTGWIKRQTTAQVNAPVNKPLHYNTIWAEYPGGWRLTFYVGRAEGAGTPTH